MKFPFEEVFVLLSRFYSTWIQLSFENVEFKDKFPFEEVYFVVSYKEFQEEFDTLVKNLTIQTHYTFVTAKAINK